MSFRQILQMARSPRPLFEQILKWNRNQVRNPAGTKEGGRWAKGGGSMGTQGVDAATAETTGIVPGMERSGGTGGAGWSTMRKARGNKGKWSTGGETEYSSVLLNVKAGKGFANRPRAGSGIPTTPIVDPHETVVQHLRTEKVTDSRPLGSGQNANASVIVTLEDGLEAVYKPERGESWHLSFSNGDITRYVKNKDFSLAAREAFAYEVDTAVGLGIVPETVLNETVDETNIEVDTSDRFGGGGGGDFDTAGGYDSYEAHQQYNEYKEKAQEQAMEAVGEEMSGLYQEAQKEHVSDIESRLEEVQEIWDEEMEAFVDPDAHGSRTAMAEHPVLPLGSKEPFERLEDAGVLNPIEFIDEAEVDVSSRMSLKEKAKVRELIQAKLKEGYTGFDEVDEDDAKEHLDYDNWRENHEMTEDRLYQSKIQTFTEWRHENGYDTAEQRTRSGGGGDGGDANPEAPHPQGGSFQHFRSDATESGEITESGGAKLAVLDYLIGTMDRHPHNMMYDENNDPVAIDNGYSMPAVPESKYPDGFQFRSHATRDWVANHGGKVPENLRVEMHTAMKSADWQAVMARHPNMNELEKAAFLGRVNKMTTALSTPGGLKKLWGGLDNMW